MADLLQGVLPLVPYAEAHLDDLLFLRRQRLENVPGFLAHVGVDHRVDRRVDPIVLDEVPESRFAITTYRRLQGNGIARDALELLHLLRPDLHTLADLLVVRSAAQFLLQLARSPQELVHRLVHVNRDADRSGLVGDRAGDRLPDPPRRVRRELVPAPVLELFRGAHQANVAFLDQVEEVQAPIDVLLGHRNDQAQIRLDQRPLGFLSLALPRMDHLGAGAGLGRSHADLLLSLPQLFLQAPQRRAEVVRLDRGAPQLANLQIQSAQAFVGVQQAFAVAVPDMLLEADLLHRLGDLDHVAPTLPLQLLVLAPVLAVGLRNGRLGLFDAFESVERAQDQRELVANLLFLEGHRFRALVGMRDIDHRGHAHLARLDLVVESEQVANGVLVARDRLPHAKLAALHAPRQVDLTLSGQQRDRAHLTQIDAYRIVGVDGLFCLRPLR